MWLMFLEAVIAGALLVFAMWWTIGSRRRSEDLAEPPSPGSEGDSEPK